MRGQGVRGLSGDSTGDTLHDAGVMGSEGSGENTEVGLCGGVGWVMHTLISAT